MAQQQTAISGARAPAALTLKIKTSAAAARLRLPRARLVIIIIIALIINVAAILAMPIRCTTALYRLIAPLLNAIRNAPPQPHRAKNAKIKLFPLKFAMSAFAKARNMVV